MSSTPDKQSRHRIHMRLDSFGSRFEISGAGWGVVAVCAVLIGYAGARAAGLW